MNNRGFSLLELALVMAILAILSIGAAVWFFGYQRQAEVESSAKIIVNVLRDAQSRSMSGKDFKRWGVYFDIAGNKFILFRDDGAGYAGAAAKEENYLSSFVKIGGITIFGGGNEIIFNNLGGGTAQYGLGNGNNTAVKIEQANDSSVFKSIIVTPSGKIDRQ